MEQDAATVDPLMHGLRSKGLKKGGSVSLVGAVAIGLAATAPAYSLTGALGHGAEEAGYQLPIVFILAVIPMYFVALAYKHLTDAAPDAGTVFTWGGSKAIAPHVGWMGGFALVLSSILAGVGAAGILTNAVAVVLGMDESPVWFDLIVATIFILLTTWLVARGAEESSRTTLILTIVQYGGLILFAVVMGGRRRAWPPEPPMPHRSRGSGLTRSQFTTSAACSVGFWWPSSSSGGASTPHWPCPRKPPGHRRTRAAVASPRS